MEEQQFISRNSKVKKSYGSFRFSIEGYSGLSHRVGDSTESPEFELCGHTWQLRIFPGGSLETHRGYVSYYLASKSTQHARASYKLIILSQSNSGHDEVFASSGVRFFEAKGLQVDGWGRDKFMSSTVLLNSEFGYCINDTVVFKVEITVYGELEHQNPSHSNDMTAPSLSRHMGLLLNNEIDYDCNDIVIKFDDETAPKLKAHRCILSARSAVFKAMLKSCMSEATTGEILIHDIDFVVMQELLTYMYTDSCSSKDAFEILVEQLLFASTKYQVLGLLHQCEEHFIHQLNSKTVLTILEMADVYNASMLKEAALQFIVQNSHAITKTNEYIQLNKDLQDEVKRAIDDSIRRKGCREAIECGERRLMRTCVIM